MINSILAGLNGTWCRVDRDYGLRFDPYHAFRATRPVAVNVLVAATTDTTCMRAISRFFSPPR